VGIEGGYTSRFDHRFSCKMSFVSMLPQNRRASALQHRRRLVKGARLGQTPLRCNYGVHVAIRHPSLGGQDQRSTAAKLAVFGNRTAAVLGSAAWLVGLKPPLLIPNCTRESSPKGFGRGMFEVSRRCVDNCTVEPPREKQIPDVIGLAIHSNLKFDLTKRPLPDSEVIHC